MTLVERLASLAEATRAQQALLARMGEQSIELRNAINRLGERGPSEADREALAAHQRTLESHLARLVEDNARNRTALADDLRGELRLLARTISSSSRGTSHPGDG